MRQLTLPACTNRCLLLYKLPMRQLTDGAEVVLRGEIYKLPMRQLTATTRMHHPSQFYKLPMRQLT